MGRAPRKDGQMKFCCNSKELVNALSVATRVMASHSPMEILEGILLDVDADTNTITVTASDGNMTSLTQIPAEVITDGIAVMPGRFFADIIRKLPDGRMEANLSQSFVLSVKCGYSHFNIAGRPADSFPVPEQVDAQNVVEVSQPVLKDMINTVAFAIPDEDTRKVLTGGCVNIRNGVMDLVGLDGYRMGMRTARLDDEAANARSIIPVKALEEISRLMSDSAEEKARLCFGKNRLLVEAGNTRFFCSLIEGEYIDYKRVIPGSFTVKATVNRERFAGCVERASLIARQSKNNLLKLSVGDGAVIMTASSEAGDVREELDADVMGSLDISFNVKYLTEIARVVSGENIVLNMNTPVTPCVISPDEGDGFTYLVLPVRTNA